MYFFSLLRCRASPSEFVIPLGKYIKAVYHTRVSVGMRFRMLFETEESSVRRYGSISRHSMLLKMSISIIFTHKVHCFSRYMGTITAIVDLDSVRWPNSHWRSVKVVILIDQQSYLWFILVSNYKFCGIWILGWLG